MPIQMNPMPRPMEASIAGMQRASQGMEQAGDAIVRSGLSRAASVNQVDKVSLSAEAQAVIEGAPQKPVEDHMMDLKKYQSAHTASAKVAKMASQRTNAFAEIIAQHGSQQR